VKLYLDTSSLVKLYVAESGSDLVRQLVDKARAVCTSLVTYPETRATFARLRLEGRLTEAEFTFTKHEFDAEWPTYVTVGVTGSLCREAGELAERFGLRGFDGIHLASFAEIARDAGIHETSFSTFDERLDKAARRLARSLARTGQ